MEGGQDYSPVLVTLSICYYQVLYFSHHVFGGFVGEIDCSSVVGLLPAIFCGQLVEAAAVYADYDPGVEEEIVCCFEVADVFISDWRKTKVSDFGVLGAGNSRWPCHNCVSFFHVATTLRHEHHARYIAFFRKNIFTHFELAIRVVVRKTSRSQILPKRGLGVGTTLKQARDEWQICYMSQASTLQK